VERLRDSGTPKVLSLGLSHDVRAYFCQRLNRSWSDTQILYALYKKLVMRGSDLLSASPAPRSGGGRTIFT
jgi:hypothetical protein